MLASAADFAYDTDEHLLGSIARIAGFGQLIDRRAHCGVTALGDRTLVVGGRQPEGRMVLQLPELPVDVGDALNEGGKRWGVVGSRRRTEACPDLLHRLLSFQYLQAQFIQGLREFGPFRPLEESIA